MGELSFSWDALPLPARLLGWSLVLCAMALMLTGTVIVMLRWAGVRTRRPSPVPQERPPVKNRLQNALEALGTLPPVTLAHEPIPDQAVPVPVARTGRKRQAVAALFVGESSVCEHCNAPVPDDLVPIRSEITDGDSYLCYLCPSCQHVIRTPNHGKP